MKIECQYELNRAWIHDEEEDEIIGETNFVVPADWLEKVFKKHFSKDYPSYSLEEFLDVYEPETDGEFIYQEAIKDDALIEDLGIVMC